MEGRKEGRVEKKTCPAHPPVPVLKPGTLLYGREVSVAAHHLVLTSKPFHGYR